MEGKRELRSLLIKATRDKTFRDGFLKDPEAVAKDFGVSLTKMQLGRIASTAEFVASISEMLIPCEEDPACYPPLDHQLLRWRVLEVVEFLRWIWPHPPSYPPRYFERGFRQFR